MLDDGAIRTYPTRSSSSMLPHSRDSSSSKSGRPSQAMDWNASDRHWPDETYDLGSSAFSTKDKTTDSTRGKRRMSPDGGPQSVYNLENSGALDISFGEQTVLFDNQKGVKVTGGKSSEEDERNMDGRGEQDHLPKKNIRITNAHIESSITDRLILGDASDEAESIVGNHKSIEATPTLKNKLNVNTIVQPQEDTSHGTKGSHTTPGNVFNADSIVADRTNKAELPEMVSGLKDAVSNIEKTGESFSEVPLMESLSRLDSSLLSGDDSTSHNKERASPGENKESTNPKNEGTIKTEIEKVSDSVIDVDQPNGIVNGNLGIENSEIIESVVHNSELMENSSISHVKNDGVLNSNPEHPDWSTTILDKLKTEEKSTQSDLNDNLTGNNLSEVSDVKVVMEVSATVVAPEHQEIFSNESHPMPDALISDVSNTSASASNLDNNTLSTKHLNETIGPQDSPGLLSNDSLPSSEDTQSDEKTDDIITEDEAVAGDDVRTVNKSEESDVDKTAEGKQKDSIETYSQFAERVAMEKMNDGNGQSGATKGVGGSNASPNTPRLSAGKKYNNKNYAAPDCGSKLLAANPEAQHASSVIKRDRDDYLLNDCKSKTWFIVELCESIRPSRFEIANFELFSNLPKDVVVYGSQRYPSRDWTLLGEYMGEPANRGVQAFPVTTEPFFKYIKVEILSHYGSEYYCPVSLFQVYGVSEFEVIDSMEDGGEEIEEEPVDLAELKKEEKKERSMFPTVLRSVLYNVLGALNKAPFFNIASKSNQTPTVDECSTLDPRYKIDERKCSLAPTINWHLGCYDTEYRYLLKIPLIQQTVKSREFCKTLVDNLCTEKGNEEMMEEDIKEGKHVLSGNQVDLNYACSKEVCGDSYVCVMLCSHHLLALCHIKHFNLSATSSSSNSSVSCEDANVPNNRSVNDKTSAIPEVPSSNLVLKDAVVSDKSQITGITDKNKNKEVAPSHVRDDVGFSNPQNDYVTNTDGNKTELNLNSSDGKPATDVRNTHSGSEEPVGTETKKSTTKKEKKAEGSNQDKKTSKTDQKKDPAPESKHGSNGVRNGDNGGSKNGNGSPLPTVEQDPLPPKDGNGGNVAAAPINKESVVVRLSNKIKALEHNLSINSQYLEELSQRYKQQMEEMQLQFSAAVSALNASQPHPTTSQEQETESDVIQEQVLQLQVQIQQLSEVVSQLSVEQETFSSSVVQQHLLLMFVEVFLLLTAFWLCMRRQRRQISDQLYRMSPTQLPYTTRDALPCTERDESPSFHENCAQTERLNRDQPLALQWANEEKNDPHQIQERKPKLFDKKAHISASNLQRSGSVDNSKHKRRKRDRRASMHNLNKAGPFQDLLRDSSGASGTKRKKRNKAITKTGTLQPTLFEPSSCSAHLQQKCTTLETADDSLTDSRPSGASIADRDTTLRNEATTASPSPRTSWASKIEGQSSSPLKGSCFDWISEENKCGASSKSLVSHALGDTVSEDIFVGLEDSAIVAEALEIAIKQGRKVSKETLTRLLLAKMSNEKRIKLAKETRREASKRKNLNKSSAGVLFSCEKHTDKKKEILKKEHLLPSASDSSEQCKGNLDKSAIGNNSRIQPTAEDRISSCLPYLHFPGSSGAEVVNFVHPGDLLATDTSQLMRISECSESSGILNSSLDTEVLSDSSESPLHTALSRRLFSTNSHFDDQSSSALTKCDLELKDLLMAMSHAPDGKNSRQTLSLPEIKSNIVAAAHTRSDGVSFLPESMDSEPYTSSAIPITNSLPQPVLVNGNHSPVCDGKKSGTMHYLSLINDGSKQASKSEAICSKTLQNESWIQVAGKSSSKTQHTKKKFGHKRTGSDGILSYNGKSNYNIADQKTNSCSVVEKKKFRKLKRNTGYGSLGESISSHCEAAVNGDNKSSSRSYSNIPSSVRRKSDTECRTARLDGEKCRSAEEVRHRLLAREEEGER
ncbi:SUN domain [Trinorchestia longiramus]|nr:SUN domain [Trinorchestia longiramus]